MSGVRFGPLVFSLLQTPDWIAAQIPPSFSEQDHLGRDRFKETLGFFFHPANLVGFAETFLSTVEKLLASAI